VTPLAHLLPNSTYLENLMSKNKAVISCQICASRAALHDAISAEVKAAAQVYHLANHWRSAHETRELSNFAAEERSAETLVQFDSDMTKEDEWFEQYQEAIKAHAAAADVSRVARAAYLQHLTAYTNTRKAKK